RSHASTIQQQRLTRREQIPPLRLDRNPMPRPITPRTLSERRQRRKLTRRRPVNVNGPRPRRDGASLNPPPPLHRKLLRIPRPTGHLLRSRERHHLQSAQTAQKGPHIMNHQWPPIKQSQAASAPA